MFASEGARVICAARSHDLVEETASAIKQAGGDAIAVTADVSREDEAKQLMQRAVDVYGRLDTLVNNAGDGGPTKPIQDYAVEDWFYTLNSCLTSSYLVCGSPSRT